MGCFKICGVGKQRGGGKWCNFVILGRGARKLKFKLWNWILETENSGECVEPHNSLFVKWFMVKIPRTTTSAQILQSDAAPASQALSQSRCSLGRLPPPQASENSVPQTAGWHFTQPSPLHSLWIQQPCYTGEGTGKRPPILSSEKTF